MKPPCLSQQCLKVLGEVAGLLEDRKPEGGTRQSLGEQSLQTANLSFHLHSKEWGIATQERYGSLVNIRGSLERPE